MITLNDELPVNITLPKDSAQNKFPLPSVVNTLFVAPPDIFMLALDPKSIVPVSLVIRSLVKIKLASFAWPGTVRSWVGELVPTPNRKLAKSIYTKALPEVVNWRSTPWRSRSDTSDAPSIRLIAINDSY